MKEKFSKLRSDYPEMCVMTQYDTTSSWTKDRPSYPVLRRIILLARESLSFISKNIFDKSVNLKVKQAINNFVIYHIIFIVCVLSKCFGLPLLITMS